MCDCFGSNKLFFVSFNVASNYQIKQLLNRQNKQFIMKIAEKWK